MKKISLLGSTGSIGESALDVVRASEGRLEAAVLCAGSNTARLAEQAREFRPALAVIADTTGEEKLRHELSGLNVEVASGEEGVLRAAAFDGVDTVLSAIVGAAGIRPAWQALQSGKDLALANKETLVAAGEVIMEAARTSGKRILPVDSEHSAVFQTIDGRPREEIARICLTASGGPFRCDDGRDPWSITPADALRHPSWSMGDKVTIDSATLMNKGLEVIEAHWLFGFPLDRIDVLVHPQSIVHSIVEFVDGSLLAHLSRPDMRLPIAAALNYPLRESSPWPRLDLAQIGKLEFHLPDEGRFPSLKLARRTQERGAGAPAALNAANEVAVEAFLAGKIRFPEIFALSQQVVDDLPAAADPGTVDGILAHDAAARQRAAEVLLQMNSTRKV